ncbi:MAG: dTMP kinase [Candidatus Methylacidiphilales bacterium]
MRDCGRLITLEGSEGCGKTTQLRLLNEHLRSCGLRVLAVREPGGTPVGEAVRHLLKHSPDGRGMCPETELLLFAASRAELVRKLVRPALADGVWVLCDRFYDSTTVYQGIARGLPPNAVSVVNEFAVGSCRPDLTLLFDLPVETALARMKHRPASGAEHDRMEAEPESFYARVRHGYLELAAAEPERFRVIDADGSPEEVFQRVVAVLNPLLYAPAR